MFLLIAVQGIFSIFVFIVLVQAFLFFRNHSKDMMDLKVRLLNIERAVRSKAEVVKRAEAEE